jgi:enoyl-CoA hydratase/carnithine racemase
MPDKLVVAETRAEVMTLTFNRPEKLNALSTPMLRQFEEHLRRAEKSPEVRVVVLTGAGKAFVAGADIGEYSSQDFAAFVAYQRDGRELFGYLDRFPKPVIAAVNGYALGGGFEIVLCCDVIIASARASFGLPEGLLGLCPGGGGTQKLTRAVGRYVAADVLLAARRLTAQEAQEIGLVSEVVEPDALLGAALDKAESMRRVAPLAQREMKRLIRQGPDGPLETGLSFEQEVLFRLYHSRDAAEGIHAFVDKRQPEFRGE